jgi:hypothetical protein
MIGFVSLVAAYASNPSGLAGAADDGEYAEYEDGDHMADCDGCDFDCDGVLSAEEAEQCDADSAALAQPQASGAFRLTEFASLGEVGLLYRHAGRPRSGVSLARARVGGALDPGVRGQPGQRGPHRSSRWVGVQQMSSPSARRPTASWRPC